MKISSITKYLTKNYLEVRFLKIDWKEIRTLNGSQQNGFEELCSQIANLEIPPGTNFVRNGTPDGGVECYVVLPDGSEWGWQAKYFNTLGDSQWLQIDKSVKNALDKHPKLRRYYVCVPLDLPDARIDGQQSARQKWNNHVKKWVGWALEDGMNVEFVYWGSHELITRLLAAPKNVGLVRFWFDTKVFDETWFEARFKEARKTAGPRYTPEINVELPIIDDFEAFGRTVHFFDGLKTHARGIRDKLRSFNYKCSESSVEAPDFSSLISQITSLTEQILSDLSSMKVQPVGELPFQKIFTQAVAANEVIEKFDKLLYTYKKEYDTKKENQKGDKRQSTYSVNPFQELQYRLIALKQEIRDLSESLENANRLTSSNILLLTGGAGTGKTHLLCDIADRRTKEGYPTVLLMGQRFISESEPWAQVLQQLDLPGLSAEEFVSTLEVAAQTAGCRALVLIDALNEGAGRRIWPSHLEAFLARLECSPWIGVVLCVRSSYEQFIIPEGVRERAVKVEHYGFADYEYDATQTFFSYYGLELPSTPLLAPEFRNPLFLKTLCHGLKESGNHRLPRGFHGITATFELFLDAINNKLASELSFNVKIPLVKQALYAFTRVLIDTGESWLPLIKAEAVVNELLPGRYFDRSLYHGLVSEGILVEEVTWNQDKISEDVVFIAYERFADHLTASLLLDAYMNTQSPETAFVEGAPLGFLCDSQQYVASGLLEALCLQVPERTGKELIEVAPAIKNRNNIGKSFRNSIAWRATNAFSSSILDSLNELTHSYYDFAETIDIILTVATLPEHPLNASYLDRRLLKDSMPDRDAWWSTYLHKTWQTHGAVDRLIDWTSAITQQAPLDDEIIDLCSTALAWMLTTSNRFLRDRVTKALVSLLTGRLDATARLVERFADVDDFYVTERVYAVAYGVAMQSHDSEKVGSLAMCVYSQVFATETPPVHILLRDYARGVIERALFLGANIDVNEDNIRPPYKSSWPDIPNEDEIKPLLPNWSRGSYDSRDLEWARNRIGGSVMGDDFARYVIGTDIGHKDFLSLKIDEPLWQSPNERLAALVTELSGEEMIAWEAFDDANKELEKARPTYIETLFKKLRIDTGNEVEDLMDIDEIADKFDETRQQNIETLEKEKEIALRNLSTSLSEKHLIDFNAIISASENGKQSPPYFDISLIQRYILWRVFDLGWTIERFGNFDRFVVGDHGRGASKAERIGKKYQWIAYYEIMALIADHFQFCYDCYRDYGSKRYEGPWQIDLRDIDPSCTLIPIKTGEPWSGHSHSWWSSVKYENWNTPQDQLEWAKFYDDLPNVEDLLSIKCPKDGSKWLNLHGFFNWKQPSPADRDPIDVEGRELWYHCIGYFIRNSDVEALVSWAKNIDFSGRMMSQLPENYGMFLGEYGWSPAWHDFREKYLDAEEWIQLDRNCPVKVRIVASEHHCKASEFDFSVDDNRSLKLPAGDVVSVLGMRWSGYGADFIDETGQIVSFDPTAHSEGPSALLLRQDKLKEFLEREKLVLCWIVTGEKLAYGTGFTPREYSVLRMSGFYILDSEGPTGSLNCFLENRSDESDERSNIPLVTLRENLSKE